MDDPLGLSRPRNAPAARQVKEWVADSWGLPDTAVVTVSELQCFEEDCPPLETVIAVQFVDRPRIEHRLHKAISDVCLDDITRLKAKQ